jgi:hypothetical protein
MAAPSRALGSLRGLSLTGRTLFREDACKGDSDLRRLLGIIVLCLALPRTSTALQLVSASPTGVSGSHPSLFPSISGNGRYVAWVSGATNLLGDIGACDPQFGVERIYLRDNLTQTTEDVLPPAAIFVGTPALSETGRYVGYICGSISA